MSLVDNILELFKSIKGSRVIVRKDSLFMMNVLCSTRLPYTSLKSAMSPNGMTQASKMTKTESFARMLE